jgi:outer membrane protein
VFTLPLFSSGMNSSRVREASDKDLGAALEIEQSRRMVIQQVSQSWDRLTAAHRVIAVVAKQLDAEAVAFEGNRLEEHAGLRSVLDLLNSEAELASTRVADLQVHHDEFVAGASLLSAMGVLEVDQLTLSPQAGAAARPHRDTTKAAPPPPEDAIGTLLDRIGAPATPHPSEGSAGGTRPNPADHPARSEEPVAVGGPAAVNGPAVMPAPAAVSGNATAKEDVIGELLGQGS